MNTSFRGGMQVHAVPESERAYDAAGKQLPWGYEYADPEGDKRNADEKGPFGRSTQRRMRSRTRTTTPAAARKDEAVIAEQRAVDDIFSSYITEKAKEDALRERQQPTATLSGPEAANAAALTPAPGPASDDPTEVMLYGFGPDFQWAAIDFYEKVSNGTIFEDYDRQPPHQRYNLSRSLGRASTRRSLSQAAIRKKNRFHGGDHWIKVTFDSPQAAELACHFSPHVLHGFTVYAEPYRGVGPASDAPIPASQNGTPTKISSPSQRSSTTLQSSRTLNGAQDITPSSQTLSSATATGTAPSSQPPHPPPSETTATSTAVQRKQAQKPLGIRGAKRAVLLPAEQAFLPSPSKWNRTLAALPIIGWLLASSGDIIGNQVPRLENGEFDWNKAGLYWQFWFLIDSILGSDFCGLKDDE